MTVGLKFVGFIFPLVKKKPVGSTSWTKGRYRIDVPVGNPESLKLYFHVQNHLSRWLGWEWLLKKIDPSSSFSGLAPGKPSKPEFFRRKRSKCSRLPLAKVGKYGDVLGTGVINCSFTGLMSSLWWYLIYNTTCSTHCAFWPTYKYWLSKRSYLLITEFFTSKIPTYEPINILLME